MYDVDAKRKTLPDVEFDASYSTSSSFDCSIEKYFEQKKSCVIRHLSRVPIVFMSFIEVKKCFVLFKKKNK